jgi:competence protein ComEC
MRAEGDARRGVSLRLLIVAWAAGVVWLQTRPELPGWAWLWLLPPVAIAASLTPPASRVRRIVWLGIACLAGFAYAAWRAEARLDDRLAEPWAGRDIHLLGQVVGLVEDTPGGRRFEFRVLRVGTPGAQVPSRLSLNLRVAPGAVATLPRGGACLTLRARLYAPRGADNPGGFDYEAWLFQRGIRAVGRALPESVGAAMCPSDMRARLDGWREDLRHDLNARLAGSPHGGIVAALALGDQDAISAEAWRLFRRTGVTHLMSISGLHVTLLGVMAYGLVLWAWRRVPALTLRWPARRAAAWFGLAVSAGYVVLSGFGVPAQRTLYMLLGATLAMALDRAHSASRVLAPALLLVLLIDPWAVLGIGFWLSFGVVAALLHADAGRAAGAGGWRAWVRTQWVAGLALAPPLLYVFQEYSLVSPLANFLAIPLVSLVAVPLSLLAAFTPWQWPADGALATLGVTWKLLTWLDALPRPVWHGAAPSLPALLLAVLGVAWLLLPRGMPGRWLGLLLCLPLLFPRLDRPTADGVRAHVLDVGQGLAVVVRTANHALVYDAGPMHASGEDAGQRVVAPFLHAIGAHRLDGLIVSHDDIDHSGGAGALLDGHAPDWLLSSLADPGDGRLSAHGRALLSRARHNLRCDQGMAWTWDGVRFEVLYPPARYHANPGFEDNDRSCVLRVRNTQGAMLLVGDLARLGEMTLVEAPGGARADVLVVGHHGAATSTSDAFLAAVAPSHALISVGQGNSFGHPAADTLRRLATHGARIWRTDRDGAIEARLEAPAMTIATTRPERRRYWRETASRPHP